jgi:Uma2 family endonuclease
MRAVAYPSHMQLVLPDRETPETFVLTSESLRNDDEFFAFCAANPDLRLERNKYGEVVIMAPSGSESSFQNLDCAVQLGNWAKANKQGVVFDSNGGFRLPSGAVLAADAAWVRKDALAAIPKEEKRKFAPVCPNFVIEILSPIDSRREARHKMKDWILEGVELAWLIDPDERLVEIYRPNQQAQQIFDATEVRGEGPVDGLSSARSGKESRPSTQSPRRAYPR